MTTDRERYLKACHAMQTGVAVILGSGDTTDSQPKHLRVGINSAHVSDAAIVKLLIDKGIFTQEEFDKVLADEMEKEVESYKARIKDQLNIEPELY